MPEIVRDGATGWLVADVDQAVNAVARLSLIDRRACREEAVNRFGSDRMIDDHLAVLERVLAEGVKRPRSSAPGSGRG